MGALQSTLAPRNEAVFICGIHAAYPDTIVDQDFLSQVIPLDTVENHQQFAKLHAINWRTGIKTRPVILNHDHEFYHRPEPFKVEELTSIWLDYGLPLSERACRGALTDCGSKASDITHLIAATCSVQCHPGIDIHVAQRLQLRPTISRTLLSGVGCAGGAALLRTAFELANAATLKKKPARILIFACDINSLGFRAEIESWQQDHFPIGLTLFSDAATAAIVSNEIGAKSLQKASGHLFEIRQWMNFTIPDTLHELQLMPTSIGAVSVISPRLPQILATSVRDLFFNMMASHPPIIDQKGNICRDPADFDWDIHPGGLGIFDQILKALGLNRQHAAATVQTYENWGNSAGPTLLKVLDVRRNLPVGKEFIVSCGFGNNVDITMLILRRSQGLHRKPSIHV